MDVMRNDQASRTGAFSGFAARIRPAHSIRSLALIACMLGLQGCLLPVLTVADALLGISGGTPSAGQNAGPFSGAPSSSQNRAAYDPAISDVLDAADSETVSQSCKAQLPEELPEPSSGCVLRWACLPGAGSPMQLRLCAVTPETMQTTQTAQSAVEQNVWAWDESGRQVLASPALTSQD